MMDISPIGPKKLTHQSVSASCQQTNGHIDPPLHTLHFCLNATMISINNELDRLYIAR